MAYTEKTYQLNSAGVDAVSEDVRVWLESMNVDHKDTIRIRLTIEELLLRISEHAGGENVTGTLRLGKRLGAPYISFRYDGESFDPRETNADEWSEQILSNLGLAPTKNSEGSGRAACPPAATSLRSGWSAPLSRPSCSALRAVHFRPG